MFFLFIFICRRKGFQLHLQLLLELLHQGNTMTSKKILLSTSSSLSKYQLIPNIQYTSVFIFKFIIFYSCFILFLFCFYYFDYLLVISHHPRPRQDPATIIHTTLTTPLLIQRALLLFFPLHNVLRSFQVPLLSPLCIFILSSF